MMQSTGGAGVGQACVLQGMSEVTKLVEAGGHGLPPCAGAVTTCREINCFPPPHDAEHSPNL